MPARSAGRFTGRFGGVPGGTAVDAGEFCRDFMLVPGWIEAISKTGVPHFATLNADYGDTADCTIDPLGPASIPLRHVGKRQPTSTA